MTIDDAGNVTVQDHTESVGTDAYRSDITLSGWCDDAGFTWTYETYSWDAERDGDPWRGDLVYECDGCLQYPADWGPGVVHDASCACELSSDGGPPTSSPQAWHLVAGATFSWDSPAGPLDVMDVDAAASIGLVWRMERDLGLVMILLDGEATDEVADWGW